LGGNQEKREKRASASFDGSLNKFEKQKEKNRQSLLQRVSNGGEGPKKGKKDGPGGYKSRKEFPLHHRETSPSPKRGEICIKGSGKAIEVGGIMKEK